MPTLSRAKKGLNHEAISKGFESPADLQSEGTLDITLVFGHGPIRSVKIPSELTPSEKEEWKNYKAAPERSNDLDFFVIESDSLIHELQAIRENKQLSERQKHFQLAKIRSEWQHMSIYSLRRFAKLTALAAGILLLNGKTKKLLITGGHTISERVRGELREQYRMSHEETRHLTDEEFEKKFSLYLKYFIRWPSEAELMADLIKKYFGWMYEERYGRSIGEVMLLESNATNTIENIVLSLNVCSLLHDPRSKIGVLSLSHHLPRIEEIAAKFGLAIDKKHVYSSHDILLHRYRQFGMENGAFTTKFLGDKKGTNWLQDLFRNEKRLLRGLTENEYLTYWLGYTFESDDPERIDEVLKPLLHSAVDEKILGSAFAQAGIDYTVMKKTDFKTLAEDEPEVYDTIIQRLTSLTKLPLRAMPPLD